MKRSLSVLALLLSLLAVLSLGSFSAYAESSDATGDVTVDITADDTTEAASDAASEAASGSASEAESKVESAGESKDASAAESKEESKDSAAASTNNDNGSRFPWALVIFLAVVVVLAVVCAVCIKLDNRFGKWLKRIFKDHKSELNKVTWPSRDFTIKSTIVVLVCLVVSGLVIGLLDFGLAKLVELFRDLVS